MAKHAVLLLLLSFGLSFTSANAQNGCGFVSQITNNAVVNKCSNSPVTLNSLPVGAAYSYQWQKQTSAGAPFANIAGATSGNYSTNEVGAYRVLISNGTCTDTSGIFNLIQINLQGGTISGGSSLKICRGANGGLLIGSSVEGSELGLVNFEWERNVDNAGWEKISGATSKDYNVLNVTANTQIRRVAVDNCGNKAYSNTVSLTTIDQVKPGSVTPLSQTIAMGAAAANINSAIAANGGSGNLSYQWASSLYERGPFTNITGATGGSYAPGNLSQTTYFKRICMDALCSTESSIQEVAVVIVNGSPLNAGYFYSNSTCFFPGQSASPLEAAGQTGGLPPYTIEWQSSNDNSSWTTIANSAGIIFQPPLLSQTTYFRAKVTDAAGSVAYSGSEKIVKVETMLTAGSISASANVACLGSPVAPIDSQTSPTGFGENLSFQWQYKTVTSSWKDIAGQIRENITPEPIAEKTFFRRAAIDACGPNKRTVFSNEVEIDIRPALVAGSINPTSQIVFSNGTPRKLNSGEAPSGGTGSYTLSWEKSALSVGPWSTIDGASNVSYQPTALTEPTYYKRVVKDNNCLATKYTYVVEVSVNNAPALTGGILAGSTCVFPNNRPSIIESSSAGHAGGGTPPLTFQWEHRAGATGPFASINGATSETYRPAIITQTHQYRRKVTDAFGMFAYSDTITINYITAPLLPGSIKATTPLTVCGTTVPGLIASTAAESGSGQFFSYQWQVSTNGNVWDDIEGAVREAYQPTASITQQTWFRRWAFEKCSGVTRSAVSNEVIFKLRPEVPLKGGLVDGPFITCAGSAPGTIQNVLEACGSGVNKYQWEVNTNGVWTLIDGATGSSYTPGAINENTTYRRKVTDACGKVAYSNEVLIYVYPPIEPGVISPASQTFCGEPKRLELTAECHYTDGTVTYQWESSTTGTGNWTSINGATSNSFLTSDITGTMWYRLKVMSTTCSAFSYTNTAVVTPTALACTPFITADAESFCASSQKLNFLNLRLNDCPSGSIRNIQWQYAETLGGQWKPMGTGDNEKMVDVGFFFYPEESTLYFRARLTNACGAISYTQFISVTQRQDCRTSSQKKFATVYPNPTSVSNEVTIKTNIEGKKQINLKTLGGDVLDVTFISNDRTGMRIKLPHHLASAPYFLEVTNEKGEKAVAKIILAN